MGARHAVTVPMDAVKFLYIATFRLAARWQVIGNQLKAFHLRSVRCNCRHLDLALTLHG